MKKKYSGENGFTNTKLLSLYPIKQEFVSITPASVISNNCPVRTDPGLEIWWYSGSLHDGNCHNMH